MRWDSLITPLRFGQEHLDVTESETRSEFQRDYDRIVFSPPFRRLQNKTQVFPLPGSIFVHNRLTHSMEVACVGRSIAREAAAALKRKYASEPWVGKLDAAGEIVAAACLAHDMGNPPFGHSGEKAISSFFSEGPGSSLRESLTPGQWADLTHFEGNANAFRLLTHRFLGRRPGGFALTYSTLASIVKYPYASLLANHSHPKFGFFTSETADFERVAAHTGLLRLSAPDEPPAYARHPLVYIVEAADDICYEIMDIEDAHKLGLLSTESVISLFLQFFDDDHRRRKMESIGRVDDPNEKIAYLRASIIGVLVERCAEAFVENEEAILRGEFQGPLLNHIPETERQAYKACERLSWDRIYCAPDVVDIELAGNRIISFLMEKVIDAVLHPDLNYSRLLLAKIPKQYEKTHTSLYGKLLAAVDYISGMTDVYALDLYRQLNGMSLKINN